MKLLCIWKIQVTIYAFVLSLTACQFNPLIMGPIIHLWENAKETLKGSVSFYRTELTALKHGPSLKDANGTNVNVTSTQKLKSHHTRQDAVWAVYIWVPAQMWHLWFLFTLAIQAWSSCHRHCSQRAVEKKSSCGEHELRGDFYRQGFLLLFWCLFVCFQSAKNVLSNSTFLVWWLAFCQVDTS